MTATRDHVTFRVGQQWVGLPVETVQEVLVAQRLAPVPLAPRAVAGFLNLRGQIVTAVDLRTGLAVEGRAPGADDAVFDVVVRDDDELFALLVDEVGDVLPLADADVGPPPTTLRDPWRSACAGAVRRDADVLLVLDLPRLLRIDL
ncbi:MAG TPA: chemotaxis protein CheW [Gemmatirosa sp.]